MQNRQTYKLENVEGTWVARIYVDGKKTSAYTTEIPPELTAEFDEQIF